MPMEEPPSLDCTCSVFPLAAGIRLGTRIGLYAGFQMGGQVSRRSTAGSYDAESAHTIGSCQGGTLRAECHEPVP